MLNLCFIGSGNICQTMLAGLADDNDVKLTVSSPNINQKSLSSTIHSVSNNVEAITNSDIIILTVKPAIVSLVLSEIAPHLDKNQLLVSVAAGISFETMACHLKDQHPIMRAMPNIAASINQSATILSANNHCSTHHSRVSEQLFSKLGSVDWVSDEQMVNMATALVGSGPAFVLKVISALSLSGRKLGLDKSLAERLAIQTTLGAASLAKHSLKSPDELIDTVCSKGGTTQAGLASLEKNDVTDIIKKAIISAYNRAKELDTR